MTTATQPFTDVYNADPVHSSFGFAVVYQGISTFRGTFDEVSATLAPNTNGELELEGRAKVESISIRQPEAFRAHVLSDEFFGAERHPEVVFKSSKIDLADDGAATVEGTLAIKGIEKPVVARGSWQALEADAFGRKRSHLELEAVVNRHDYKMDWNAPLPNGGQALADDVTITVDLSLVAAEA